LTNVMWGAMIRPWSWED